MPMISINALFNTIAEQDAQIKSLKAEIDQLQSLLKNQQRSDRVQALVELVKDYPEKLHYPIVLSTETH